MSCLSCKYVITYTVTKDNKNIQKHKCAVNCKELEAPIETTCDKYVFKDYSIKV